MTTSITTKQVGQNVRKLREKIFRSVEAASAASESRLGRKITIPRWYRLEAGNHPGMVGALMDDLCRLFKCHPCDLVKGDQTKGLKHDAKIKRRPRPRKAAAGAHQKAVR